MKSSMWVAMVAIVVLAAGCWWWSSLKHATDLPPSGGRAEVTGAIDQVPPAPMGGGEAVDASAIRSASIGPTAGQDLVKSPTWASSAESATMGHGLIEPGMPIWRAATLRQTLFATNFREIRILDEVQDQGEWVGLAHTRTADFDVLRIASAKKDLLALGGFDASGDFVLQRWKLKSVLGLASAQVGGQIQAGLLHKVFQVSEIYRGPLAPEIRALEFDAEARFILALMGDPAGVTLYSFQNAMGTTPAVISDSSAVPDLAAMNFMKKFDHSQVGRLWRLDDHPVYALRVFLVDFDNDGIFDSAPIPFDRQAWEATGLDEYAFWDSLTGP